MRHGEVHNPEGVLYGRLDGYHLSDLGHEMARTVADHLAENDEHALQIVRDIVSTCSPAKAGVQSLFP